ncbi:hypothetical protein V5799_007554 [Amblyomma americanum]|uniref:Uncharacterized protein n=1 Tax=Amblyomma americanum TaxID=6943 RepID=A0AAQ4FFK5_AMBAM
MHDVCQLLKDIDIRWQIIGLVSGCDQKYGFSSASVSGFQGFVTWCLEDGTQTAAEVLLLVSQVPSQKCTVDGPSHKR